MKDVKTRFITSDYKLERPLPIAQNEKVIELIKHELGGKINLAHYNQNIYLFNR